MEILSRFFKSPEGSFFLFGPGGRKTTLLRERFPEALFLDLLQPEVHRTLSARPERLAELVHGARTRVVVLAEVQRAPELLDVVHDLIERKKTAASFSRARARERSVEAASWRGDFARRVRRDTAAHPKFYFVGAGVFSSLRPKGPLDRPHEISGASLEGLVAQHLRAWAAYSEKRVELFYWRTRWGVEVDFVVYGEGGFWALEVKNAHDVRREDLRTFKAFREDYTECEPLLLHRGTNRLEIDEIRCVPADAFLRALEPSRGIMDPS